MVEWNHPRIACVYIYILYYVCILYVYTPIFNQAVIDTGPRCTFRPWQELKPLLAMGIGAAWAAHPFVLPMLLGSLRRRPARSLQRSP